MNKDRPERRAWPRFGPRADRPALSVGKLLPGRNVRLISISRGGVLLEGDGRLRPGSPADLQLSTGETRLLVRGRVVRCWVSGLRNGSMRYQAALAFLEPFELDESHWRLHG
jgi:hypothetical protein